MQPSVSAVLGALLLVPLAPAARAQNNARLQAGSPPVAEEQFTDKVIELTNIQRGRVGAPPLKRQSFLREAARWMAGDMAANRYFAHVDRLGRSIGPRFADFGYKDYTALGENIAAGQRTPREVVDTWLKSPGHRANLLNADFREIGVSYICVPNSEYGCYWVQDFGKREDIFPLIINLEATQTRSPDVKLYIYGDKWAKTMRFSSDEVQWTEWELYRADRDWKLSSHVGKQTVFVELKNGTKTRRSSASIELISPTHTAGKLGKP